MVNSQMCIFEIITSNPWWFKLPQNDP